MRWERHSHENFSRWRREKDGKREMKEYGKERQGMREKDGKKCSEKGWGRKWREWVSWETNFFWKQKISSNRWVDRKTKSEDDRQETFWERKERRKKEWSIDIRECIIAPRESSLPMSRLLQGIMLILIFHFLVTRSPFDTTERTTGFADPRPMSM